MRASFSGRAWAPDSQTPTAAWHRGRSSLRHVGWCAQTNPTTHKTHLFLFLPSSSEPREARVAYTRGPFFLSLSPPKKPWATATVKPRPHNNISNTHRPSALHPQIRVLSSFPTSPRPSPPLFHFPRSHTFTADGLRLGLHDRLTTSTDATSGGVPPARAARASAHASRPRREVTEAQAPPVAAQKAARGSPGGASSTVAASARRPPAPARVTPPNRSVTPNRRVSHR